MRIERVLWVAATVVSVLMPCSTQAAEVIASVRHAEGFSALTFADNGDVYFGAFGDPGSWQTATPVPERKPLAGVTQFDTGGGVLIITTDGSVYWGSFASLPGTWTELTAFPLPGELGALSWLGTSHSVLAITRDGHAFRGSFGNTPGTWTEVTPVPLPPVAINAKSWSGVKDGFRR